MRAPTARPQRFVLILIAVATVIAGIGLIGVDRLIAEQLHASGWESAWFFHATTEALDSVGLLLLPKYWFGAIVAVLGLLLALRLRWRRSGIALALAGGVQCASVFAISLLKGVFGRLRPYELLQSGAWDHAWFVGGSSFPSGHNAWYWGLFLPLAYAFPRWRWPILAIPLFIAVARIVDAAHFLSDVGAAIAIVGLITLIAEAALLPRPPGRYSTIR